MRWCMYDFILFSSNKTPLNRGTAPITPFASLSWESDYPFCAVVCWWWNMHVLVYVLFLFFVFFVCFFFCFVLFFYLRSINASKYLYLYYFVNALVKKLFLPLYYDCWSVSYICICECVQVLVRFFVCTSMVNLRRCVDALMHYIYIYISFHIQQHFIFFACVNVVWLTSQCAIFLYLTYVCRNIKITMFSFMPFHSTAQTC